MAKRFAAVVLGAGSGTILDTPQLLLKVDGTPLIRRTVDTVAKAGVSEIVVAVKSESDPVAAALAGSSARIVPVPRHQDGVATSLVTGITALGPDAAAFMILPGDLPLLTAELLASFVESFDDASGGLLVPAYQHVPGYPVLCDRRFRDQLLALTGQEGPHAVLRANPRDVLDIHLTSDAVVFDIDHEEDYQRLHQRLGLPSPTPVPAPDAAPSTAG